MKIKHDLYRLSHKYIAVCLIINNLHETSGNSGASRIPFDWEARIKIAMGTANGIAHIHSLGGPQFNHANIKSSNVLIDQDMEACISDMGLVPIINITPTPSFQSAGYLAPEVLESHKHFHKSDVYSFGILLLEILTGKQPIQSPSRGDMVDLARWVQSVVKEEWTTEVFDVELTRFHNIEDEMVSMLQIALDCVVQVPDNRPTIHEVVRRLEQIRVFDLEPLPHSD